MNEPDDFHGYDTWKCRSDRDEYPDPDEAPERDPEPARCWECDTLIPLSCYASARRGPWFCSPRCREAAGVSHD